MLVKNMYLNGVHEILPIAYKVFKTDSGRDPGKILFYLSIALINIEKAYPKKIMENDMQTIMNTFEQRMTILYNC